MAVVTRRRQAEKTAAADEAADPADPASGAGKLQRPAGELNPLAALDEKVSHALYRSKSGSLLSTLYWILAELCTISGDEVMYFTFAIPGSCIFVNRLWQGNPHGMSCAEEFCWDMFGMCSTAVFFECTAKVMFQRARPWYAKQRQNWVVYGEVYSCPSGHTLRGVYLGTQYLAVLGRKFNLPTVATAASYPVAITVWMVLVAWSRVALGKHYVGDTIVGAVMGAALAYSVEDVLPPWMRSLLYMWSGISLTAQWGKMCVCSTL